MAKKVEKIVYGSEVDDVLEYVTDPDITNTVDFEKLDADLAKITVSQEEVDALIDAIPLEEDDFTRQLWEDIDEDR